VAAVAAAAIMLGGTARAQLISGATATASSTLPGPPQFNFDRVATHVVDNSGLSPGDNLASTPDQLHIKAPDGFMWLSSGNDPFGGVDPDPTFTIDLGGLFSVTGVRIFNYNENVPAGNRPDLALRGIQQTNVLISANGVNYTSLTPTTPLTIPIAPGNDSYTGTYFNLVTLLGAPVTTRFFQLDIVSNHGGDNNFYGLSEVQFDGTPVPEVSTASFLTLSGLLLMNRRRRGVYNLS
jgi:hypothetical protein